MDNHTLMTALTQERPMLISKAYQKVRSRPDAEDIVQQTCLKAWLHLPSLKNDDSFRPWLYRILNNECISLFRKRYKKYEYITGEIHIPDTRPAVEESVVARIDINTAIASLPPKKQQVVSLYYHGGYSLAAISNELNVEASSVRNAFYKSKKKMQHMLQ